MSSSPSSVSLLHSAEDIAARLHGMAAEIHAALGDEFTIVALLKGSFVFAADLLRALHGAGCRPQVDFVTLGSYGDGMESGGRVIVERGVYDRVEGKRVLLVDDILESGRTLSFASGLLREHGAASVHIAVLLEKPGKRAITVEADFVGFIVPDRFVVGYGLDYAGYYRELPYIGFLE